MRTKTLLFLFITINNLSTGVFGQNQKTEISVDFSKTIGKIKSLHGVNNGPLVLGVNADLSIYHSEAGFPHTRLHDPRWPSPDVVDIPTIFPDFDADPGDSTNYFFEKTDDYIAAIIKNGSEIIYRLGTSIEHHTQYYIHPPADFAKWAKICVNIIRHYNEGWANGHHYNIRYWEIWNEPDLTKRMWLGTHEQYYELYEKAASVIKAYDPSLKVGGPASTGARSPIVAPFLAYCRDREIPLDFFTWHSYKNNPYLIVEETKYIRSLLNKYGFEKTENHLNEWHYLTTWEELGPEKEDLEKFKHLREKFAMTVGPIGAAYSAAVLMLMQDSPIDVMNFYSADTNPYGMFDVFGAPSKVYYVFKAFNQLAKTDRVDIQYTLTDSSVVVCAGLSANNSKGAIMLSNSSINAQAIEVAIRNFPGSGQIKLEVNMIDETRDLEIIATKWIDRNKPSLKLVLPPNSVCLVKLGSK